ncbi:MAG: hypothetical protein U0835_26510 [Isosphaeraceae bacterium]
MRTPRPISSLVAEREGLGAAEFGLPVDQVAMRGDVDPNGADFRAERLAVHLVEISDGEPTSTGIGDRFLDKPVVPDDTLVPPEVGAGEVAERQPEAGVHRGVVDGVLPFHGREAPGDLHTLRGPNVGEVGPPDRRVVPGVGGEGFPVDFDEQMLRSPLKAYRGIKRGRDVQTEQQGRRDD